MIVTAKQLPSLIARVVNTGRVPMIHGSPGVGKSDIVKAFADKNKLKLIDLRMSQMTPTSLNGFGRIGDNNKSEFIPFEDFPLETDSIPEGYDGWLLFLDEMNSAVPQVQAAAYKLVLDRMVGSSSLHEACVTIAAGNKATDGAIVHKVGTAMQSRMIHFEIAPDKDAWLEWANANGIDFRLTAYVNYKPSILSTFDPKHDDHTFTCGRTIEFASALIKDTEDLSHEDLILLAGTIGEGNAKEFYGFCSIFEELPTIKEIIKDPMDAVLKKDPSFMFGVSSYVAEHITEDNIKPLMQYVRRFKPEFQAITARHAYRGNLALISNEHMIKWLDEIGIYF